MTESNLNRVIELSYEMLELADHGDLFRTDDGCGILFGIIRDDAYKIRKLAEQELKKHDVRKNKKKQDSDSTI
ncbi:MAG: hypothetical protein GY866_43685 [Proteobacteria bacterium]|nr:hypothetical protein [Pseudomonadota bacterium]